MNKLPKIFLIDDDEFLLDLYIEKAKNENIDLIPITSAELALKRLYDGDIPDLLVVDIILPGINGIEFIKQIREEHLADTVPIIVLTNKSEPPYPQDAHKLGIEQYIVKATFLPSEVIDAIKENLKKDS